MLTPDVSQEIADAKSKAEQANSTATRVLQALGPMKEQLDKWNQSYGDANTTNEDINNALMEANKTGGRGREGERERESESESESERESERDRMCVLWEVVGLGVCVCVSVCVLGDI